MIAAIADVLRGCPGANFEIGGHTDSQGSAEANQQLSDVRSQAVLAALEAEDLPFVGLSARGFGADDPVADNASESGRAENRRIEFTLVDPEDMREPEEPEEPQATDTAAADCAAAIDAVLAEGSIQFAAGSATIAEESAPAVTAIAAALRGCPAAAFEIGGHTDSQGSDSGNLRLSTERAEAVLAALRAPDLPLPAVTARGYGEADPVADNATAEGRAQNRRIVFTPLGPEPAGEGDAEGAVAAEAGGPEATCAARIEAILAEGSIEFAAESATIAPESAELLTSIAAALRTCPDVAMEIAGHTDFDRVGVGEPAAQPGAGRRGAGGAARGRPAAARAGGAGLRRGRPGRRQRHRRRAGGEPAHRLQPRHRGGGRRRWIAMT